MPRRYRDYCAHILIPLNKCRVQNYYLPWTCSDLKHAYEKCQYDECAPLCSPSPSAPWHARRELSRISVPPIFWSRFCRRATILKQKKAGGE